MSPQIRVLVVENNEQTCTVIAGALRDEGYVVDTAFDLQQALGRLHSRTYHVGLIDLGLSTLDDSDADGLKVLDALCGLDEGTVAIVLSGKTETQLVADTLQVRGADRFLAKATLSEEGFDRVCREVAEAAKTCHLKPYGDKSNILSLVAGSQGADIWINACLGRLKPVDGYTGLRRFFEGLLDDLSPLIPLKGAEECLHLVSDAALLHGLVWSKAEAEALEIFVAGTRGSGVSEEDAEADCRAEAEASGLAWPECKIKHHMGAHLFGCAFADSAHSRTDFCDRLL